APDVVELLEAGEIGGRFLEHVVSGTACERLAVLDARAPELEAEDVLGKVLGQIAASGDRLEARDRLGVLAQQAMRSAANRLEREPVVGADRRRRLGVEELERELGVTDRQRGGGTREPEEHP